MDRKLFNEVIYLTTCAVHGNGKLQVNGKCKQMQEDLYRKCNITRTDIVNHIMSYILMNDLMDKYDGTKSLGGFITTVSFNELRNLHRKEMNRRKHEVLMTELEDSLVSYERTSLVDTVTPEDEYLRKEMDYIVDSNTNNNEYKLFYDEITVGEFAEAENITYDAARMRARRLRSKLVKILDEAGYDKII